MPCYDDHDPRYICQGERERADKAERDLLGMTQKAEWLTAALCLMTDRNVTCYATSDFEKYLSSVTPESRKRICWRGRKPTTPKTSSVARWKS